MRIIQGDRTILDARARAAPGEDVITEDYYASQPQISLTPDPNSRQKLPAVPTEVMLDDIDVANLVACAVRHPRFNMRAAVLAAIRSEPELFRQVLQFGLNAPEAFPEIRKIVAEALGRHSAATPAIAVAGGNSAAKPLLPRMPPPAHLRKRERQA